MSSLNHLVKCEVYIFPYVQGRQGLTGPAGKPGVQGGPVSSMFGFELSFQVVVVIPRLFVQSVDACF